MLPKKAIDEFKTIYQKEFGIELDEKEAIQKANELIELFKVLQKPLTQEVKNA